VLKAIGKWRDAIGRGGIVIRVRFLGAMNMTAGAS